MKNVTRLSRAGAAFSAFNRVPTLPGFRIVKARHPGCCRHLVDRSDDEDAFQVPSIVVSWSHDPFRFCCACAERVRGRLFRDSNRKPPSCLCSAKKPCVEFITGDGQRVYGPLCRSCWDLYYAIARKWESEDFSHGIRGNWANEDFSTLDPTDNERIVSKLIQFARSPEGGIYLWSATTGNGKTHLAVAAMKLARACLIEGLFTTLRDLLEDLRQGVRCQEMEKRLRVYKDIPLLVLDDVGMERRPTDWGEEQMLALIEERNSYKSPTIFTSNLPIEALEDRLGRRFASRVAGLCRGKQDEVRGRDRRCDAA